MKMADNKNMDLTKTFFTVGSQIKCRFQGDDVEGQVAAFNHSDRILMIRSPSSCGKPTNTDFILINADCVEKISVEDRVPPETLKPVDFHKLEKRRQKLAAIKKSRIRALSAAVLPEARKLFLTIIKTIEEVAWDGDNIVVLNEVRISPPYKVEDVTGEKEASVILVKKIVDKHWKEIASNSVTT
uniref:AD domain-containing protein n=1 Tax=Isotomurus palustris TaxID=36144 RepID=A0A481SUW7_9HEXA|nr:hypothetical protein [Isotomurus palustris]